MSRVLLKLSGESFADDETNFGIESSTLTRIADEIARASNDLLLMMKPTLGLSQAR